MPGRQSSVEEDRPSQGLFLLARSTRRRACLMTLRALLRFFLLIIRVLAFIDIIDLTFFHH
jgi:hypothetical protein